jgi:hypothetical protein
MGKMNSSGLPLGYIFIHSNGTGCKGAKENLLQQFFQYFMDTWKIKPVVTLCDKDCSEINALRGVFPSAKLQLCFWHVLRALKERLKILKQRPGFYNVQEAIDEFEWIDHTFVPIMQLSKEEVRAYQVHFLHLKLIMPPKLAAQDCESHSYLSYASSHPHPTRSNCADYDQDPSPDPNDRTPYSCQPHESTNCAVYRRAGNTTRPIAPRCQVGVQ